MLYALHLGLNRLYQFETMGDDADFKRLLCFCRFSINMQRGESRVSDTDFISLHINNIFLLANIPTHALEGCSRPPGSSTRKGRMSLLIFFTITISSRPSDILAFGAIVKLISKLIAVGDADKISIRLQLSCRSILFQKDKVWI